jgi:hypothetical protein
MPSLQPQLQHCQQLQAHWHRHCHRHHQVLAAGEVQLPLNLLLSRVEQLVGAQGCRTRRQGLTDAPPQDCQQPQLVPPCVHALLLLLLLLPLKPAAPGLQMLHPMPCQSAPSRAQFRPRQD